MTGQQGLGKIMKIIKLFKQPSAFDLVMFRTKTHSLFLSQFTCYKDIDVGQLVDAILHGVWDVEVVDWAVFLLHVFSWSEFLCNCFLSEESSLTILAARLWRLKLALFFFLSFSAQWYSESIRKSYICHIFLTIPYNI